MENLSKFAGGLFSKSIVRSGSKTTGSARPELSLDSTFNKFTVNSRARKLLNVVPGDYLLFIDIGSNASVAGERYYVTAGFLNKKGEWEGAKIGANSSFNYSVVYSTMLNHALDLNATDVSEIKPRELMDKGLMEERKHKNGKSFIATKKIFMEVMPYNDGEAITINEELGIVQPIFALTNWIFEEHDPKSAKLNDAGEEVEEEVEEVEEEVEEEVTDDSPEPTEEVAEGDANVI